MRHSFARTRWMQTSIDFGTGPCFLNWQEQFLMIGGNANIKGIQSFDIAANKWSEVTSAVPFGIWFPGSTNCCAQIWAVWWLAS